MGKEQRVTFTITTTGETFVGFIVDGDLIKYQDEIGMWRVVGVEHVEIQA